MTGYLRLHFVLCALIFSYGIGRAQESLPDSTATRLAMENTIDIYHHFMGEESRLYNGTEHIGYLPMNGHPFYLSDAVQMGSIVYEDLMYRNIPLQYDIVRDEVVIQGPSGDQLSLSGEKVNEFYLPGHHFVRGAKGYYDRLCSGKMILEAKRIKRVLENIEGMQVVRSIEYLDHYYVVLDGVRHSIGNIRSLFALMKDKKKEINQDLKKKKIRYKKQPEQALIEAVTYYNQSILQ